MNNHKDVNQIDVVKGAEATDLKVPSKMTKPNP